MKSVELDNYRREFPITSRFIYLDHAGIAPVSSRVEIAVSAFLKESAERAAFMYPEWSNRVVETRKMCADMIHADADEVAFVRSTSHGLSIVAEGLNWNDGDNVLIYEKEFPSNIFPWLHLRRKGVEVRIIPSRDGMIEPDDIERLMDKRTRLLSVSSVQFTNGFRTDLARTGELCGNHGVLFCVDAIQSLGVLPMDVRMYNIDFLSADGHKWMLGPEGIGIFYCRRELAEQLEPVLVGWKSVKDEFSFEQPRFELKSNALRFEEGSMNLMGIFGLGAAMEMIREAGAEVIETRVQDLGDKIMDEAGKRGFDIKTPKARNARGGIVTVSGQFDPESMRDALRKRGIMVNTRAQGIRISPHFYNTEEEILACFREMDEILDNR